MLSIPQATIATSNKRFRICVAGRRFGKTHLAIRELLNWASQPDKQVWYIAPSYRQAKQIVWKELKQKLISLNWAKKINESELTITLVNDSIIALKGSDNFDSLRGVGLDGIVMDEFADQDKAAWFEVLRPTLADKNGKALFIGTPKGRNWAYDLYNNAKFESDWESFTYTTAEGGNVSKEEIESAKRDLDERTYRQEFEATFESFSGVIYFSFDRSQLFDMRDLDPDVADNETLHIGMDFNVNPMAAVVAVKRGETLRVIDAIEIYGSNTEEMCAEIKMKYGTNRKYFAYPDASGGARSTKGQSDHNILRQNGFLVKSPGRNPPVKDRIAAVNSALKSSKGHTKLYINSNTRRLIECIEKMTYKGDTRIPDKDSGYDHLVDALGYLTVYHFPVMRPIKEDKTQVFGHF